MSDLASNMYNYVCINVQNYRYSNTNFLETMKPNKDFSKLSHLVHNNGEDDSNGEVRITICHSSPCYLQVAFKRYSGVSYNRCCFVDTVHDEV